MTHTPSISLDDLEAALQWVSAAAPFENAAYISRRRARSSTLQEPTARKTNCPKTLTTQLCTGRYLTRTILILGALLPIAMSRRGCLRSTAPYKKSFIAAV